ncbi:GTPase-associated protein 1-related protein [Streptomyces sp. NRRL F-5630]|uniref:GTPase-associated protein 1-related protein n=1 Tax=Streptomyces sp. NRRL F-5630 TaxID=1463864 RepID=UPI003D729D94
MADGRPGDAGPYGMVLGVVDPAAGTGGPAALRPVRVTAGSEVVRAITSRGWPVPEAGTSVGVLDVLPDGGRVLTRLTAQAGGVSAHCVHLPAGARLPGGRAPVAFLDAPGWGSGDPLGAEPPASSALGDFARARAPWVGAFLAGVREVLIRAGARREEETAYGAEVSSDSTGVPFLVAEKDPSLVARWIALACAVLPAEQAGSLSFTTYGPWEAARSGRLVVGVPLGSAPAVAGQRLLDGALPPAEPVTDLWAACAAWLWREGRPALAADARPALDGFALLAAAHREGLTIPAAVRALLPAALDALPDSELPHAIGSLTGLLGTEAPAGDTEATGLARVWARLEDRAPLHVTSPLAGAVLMALVAGRPTGVPVPGATSLTASGRAALAARLGPGLREAVAEPTLGPRRSLALLQAAAVLGVEVEGPVLEQVADRLLTALTRVPAEEDALPVPGALAGLPELCAVLLPRLERYAAREPLAAQALLNVVDLPLDAAVRPVPHLRMCANAASARAFALDAVAAWDELLRTSRPSWSTEPALLRTALRLVWTEQPPGLAEMAHILEAADSDSHREAGTWREAVAAAERGGTGTEAEAAAGRALAAHLFRSFPAELTPRTRARLRLLELAGDVAEGRGGDWAEQAVRLRESGDLAEPTGLLAHVYAVLGGAVLRRSGSPEGELYGLAHCGDAELLAAYQRAAREDGVAERLRTDPATAAGCFVDWTAHPGAGPGWDATCATLLDEVLRPALRGASRAHLAALTTALAAGGPHRVSAFESWHQRTRASRWRRLLGG